MELKNAYVKVSRRAILAAEAMLRAGLPEATGFHAYHAFESMGGALCTSVGEDYSMGHAHKINQFTGVANRRGLRNKIGTGVLEVAMSLTAFRNQLLYPQLMEGKVILPEEVISQKEAETLLKRVRGICKKVEKCV
jgi:HEPN domain-containing protein